MKIYDNNGIVYMQAETELEKEVLRDNKQNLKATFDTLVAEQIKKAQRSH